MNHVPNQFNILTTDYNYLVVPNLQAFLDQFPDSDIYNQFYGGMNVNVSEEETTSRSLKNMKTTSTSLMLN